MSSVVRTDLDRDCGGNTYVPVQLWEWHLRTLVALWMISECKNYIESRMSAYLPGSALSLHVARNASNQSWLSSRSGSSLLNYSHTW
jgi:hypothetical protein